MTQEELATMQAAQIAADNKEKSMLAFALISRVLTDAEMGRVAELRTMLYVYFYWNGHWGCSDVFDQGDLEKRLNESLLQQFRIRGASAKL